jgi:hypothetical protein
MAFQPTFHDRTGNLEPVDDPERSIKPSTYWHGISVRPDDYAPSVGIYPTVNIADCVEFRVEACTLHLRFQPLTGLNIGF